VVSHYVRLCRLRHVVKHEQVGVGKRSDRVSPPLVVAEFDQCGFVVERFDDSPDLAARKPIRRRIDEQSTTSSVRGVVPSVSLSAITAPNT
jgi:hypothetical protein